VEDTAATARARWALALVSIGVSVTWTLGCGGSSSKPPPQPRETAQKLPRLPREWKPHRDKSIGYAIGIPPGWKLHDKGGRVLIRSPSRLVAVTLAADRSRQALALPVGEFATSALGSIPGFKGHLRPSKPRPLAGTPLQAARTSAKGTTKGQGLNERATVLVLRRAGAVNYTVAVLENSQRRYARRDRAVAMRMVRTLRDQPVVPHAANK
jgi:hypothetical protein